MSDERVSPESSKQDFTGRPGGVAAGDGVSDAGPLAAGLGSAGTELGKAPLDGNVLRRSHQGAAPVR